MAFAEAVTTERAEYLIYTVFPLAISFWFISSIVQNPFEFIAYVSVSSSLLTIFLFELRLDDSLVKWFYNRLTDTHKEDFGRSFVSWNVFLKIWQNPVIEAPQMMSDGGKTINRVIAESTQRVVESYAIRKRLWSIRGSIYLFLSIPFLIWVGVRFIKDTNIGSTISFLFIPTIIDTAGLLIPTLLISTGFWLIQILFNMHRYRSFREELKNLVIFRYAQKLLANDALENPECYVDNQDLERINLQQELIFLDRVISRDDWAVFMDRWRPVRQNVERRGRVRFRENMIDELFANWLAHCVVSQDGRRNNNQILESARVLAMNIHYIGEFLEKTNSIKLGHHSRAVAEFTIDLYYDITNFDPKNKETKKGVLKRITSFIKYDYKDYEFAPMTIRMLLKMMNPVYLASRATSKLLNDTPRGNEDLTMSFGRFVSQKMIQYFIGRIPETKLEELQENISKTHTIRCNDFTNLTVTLVSLAQQEGAKTGLWKNLDGSEQIDTLETLLDWLTNHEKEQGVIIESFLREAGVRARKAFLRDPDWWPVIRNTQQEFIGRILSEDIQYSSKVRREFLDLPFIKEIMKEE
ncbi:MAG: membrane protein of unknown function [Candidatus Thorarchaeota archaeon]|nr:MAG: membrane protein of unknown function [Candidatus Thorarchaeota archaeon]